MLSTHFWQFVAGWFCLILAGCSQPILPSPTPTLLPATLPPITRATVTLSPTAMPLSPNKLGIHLLLDDGRTAWPITVWPIHLRYAHDLTGDGGYVTELVRSDDLELARWQTFMNLCREFHLNPIVRLATTYDRANGWWRTPETNVSGEYGELARRYAEFIVQLQWPSEFHYVIVGNEPNHGDEWGGQANPIEYARFLIDVSQALHQADPAVRVLNAPLDPYTPNTNGQPFVNGMTYLDAESFLDQMQAAFPNVFDHIDIWASHSYALGPLSEPPWQQTFQLDLINGAENPAHVDPPPGIANRGINGYEWELFKLSTYGVRPLPVMITETGWRHLESVDTHSTDNGRTWPAARIVAQYIDLAFNGNHGRYPSAPEIGWTPWAQDERVLAVTPFALNGTPHEWGHTNWLLLSDDGEVQGVYPIFDVLRQR